MPGDATPPPELPPGLLAEYLESARSQLGVLAGLAERLAAAGGDREALEALRHETHKVHGSAGSYGFMEASRLAAGMEATVKDWVARPDDADVESGSPSCSESKCRRRASRRPAHHRDLPPRLRSGRCTDAPLPRCPRSRRSARPTGLPPSRRALPSACRR